MTKLAIIGGGASGLIAAHHLQHRFDVTVFERRAFLGGNVQTLNRNIKSDSIANGQPIESGVLGFHRASSPTLHALLDSLGTRLRVSQPTASLYRAGQYFPAEPRDLLKPALAARLLSDSAYRKNLFGLRADYVDGFRRFTRRDTSTDQPARELLGPNPVLNDFILSLLGLAFSTPFQDAADLPASLASPYLGTLREPDWSYVEDGVYSYLDAIISRGTFRVVTECGPVRAVRHDDRVDVHVGGDHLIADALVLAVTPGQVLDILEDADDTEQALFSGWRDRDVATTVHTATSFYAPFKSAQRTPMDLFVDHGGTARGYNTSLNRFCGLEGNTPYSFAFGLDTQIAPETILHQTQHTVPVYTTRSMATREDIRAANGRRRTYLAGAWLYGGLHEGAALSASVAADRLLSSLPV